jgi:hypothetical protein
MDDTNAWRERTPLTGDGDVTTMYAAGHDSVVAR